MRSKPPERTDEPAICSGNWKIFSSARTGARDRAPPPFLRPSCASPCRLEDIGNCRPPRRCPSEFLQHLAEQVDRSGHDDGVARHARATDGATGEQVADFTRDDLTVEIRWNQSPKLLPRSGAW